MGQRPKPIARGSAHALLREVSFSIKYWVRNFPNLEKIIKITVILLKNL